MGEFGFSHIQILISWKSFYASLCSSFFPDTTVLKQKFRVALPALKADDDMISLRSAQACRGFRIYKLEPFVSGVFKRSVDSQLSSAGMFAEFAGNGIVNVDLLNIAEVEEFEKGLK